MRVRTILLSTALLAALGLALGVGFLAGRRLPKGLVERLRVRLGLASSADLRSPWATMPPAPFQVFESGVGTIADRMFVFGGFESAQLKAGSAVWVFDAGRNTWERRKDMPAAWTHSPPALLDGRFWFAGGFVGDNPGPTTPNVWRYDPDADAWTPGPPLPASRGGGALVELNGRLHYFGGYLPDRNTGSPDHWVLSPRTSDSATWVSAAGLPVPRGHMAGISVSGALYAIGGSVGHDPFPVDVALVHRYDPALDRWTEVASLPLPRSHFEPATFVRHGRVVIIGGRERPDGRETVADVTEYDPATNRWRALAPLPEPRLAPVGTWVGNRMIVGLGGRVTSNPDSPVFWDHRDDVIWEPGDSLPEALGEVAGGIIGDRLYLVGQGRKSTLALDLATGRWLPPGSRSNRPVLGNHHAAEVWNGRLFLFGGLGTGAGEVQVYDPAVDAWRLAPPMPFAAGSSASALIGSRMYVAGGIVGDTTTRLAARFDPEREVWTAIAPMPKARNHSAAATDGTRLFVFGGRGPGSGDANVVADGFADVQIYDPATDGWIASGDGPAAPAPLPQARGGMGKAVFVGGEFWVFGGETEHGPGAGPHGTYARVDIYDPRANTWRAGPPMPTPRHGIFPLLSGDRVYILGGGTAAGSSRSAVSEILQLPRSTP
jgi:N-acetylneuraminic acid mutarotase